MNNLFQEPRSADNFKQEYLLPGYWHIIKMVQLPDLYLLDSQGNQRAKLYDRYSDVRVWWDNGPKFYITGYVHSVKVISASTPAFQLRLDWKNQGGGVLRSETITGNVTCNDDGRRESWTYSVSDEMADQIKSISSQTSGSINWLPCN